MQSRKLCGTKWIARMQGMYRGQVCDSSRGFNFDMCGMWSRQIFYGTRSLNRFDMQYVSDELKFTRWQCRLDSLHLQSRLLDPCIKWHYLELYYLV